MKYTSLIMALLTVSATALFAETLTFRSGKVLAAELTSAKLKITGINPDAPPEIPTKAVYAVVSVKLGELRSVSIFDYVLTSYGKDFPCVAIRTGNDFHFSETPVSGRGVIQLVFATDGLLTGKLPQETLTLKSKFPPAGLHDCKILFTNIGNKIPGAISAVPAAGTFKKPEQK